MRRFLGLRSVARTVVVTVGAATLGLTVVPATQADPIVYEATAHVVTSADKVVNASVRDLYTEGTFDLVWHLEQSGTSVPGFTGSEHNRIDPSYHRASFVIDGTGLADGTYDLVGTITLNPDGSSSSVDRSFVGSLTVDTTGPAVTSLTATRSTIYPQIANQQYPASVTFRALGDLAPATAWEIRKGATKPSAFYAEQMSDGSWTIRWEGTIGWTGPRAPAGVYTLTAYDEYRNPSTVTATVTVSALHLISKVYRKTVTARATLSDSFVGRCARLRSPSSHGWKGSLGLHSNTRCKTRLFRKGGVQTLHTIKVPVTAGRYGVITVDTIGGAATSAKRSTAVVAVVSRKNKLLNRYRTKSRVGRTDAYGHFINQDQIWPDHTLSWTVFPARPGDRYDVKSFVVTVQYAVVGY